MSGTYFGYPRVPKEGAEEIGDLVVARTLYFDRIIERVVGDVEQFVLLGAGFDTRPYGTLKRQGLAFFELDQPTTQRRDAHDLDTRSLRDRDEFASELVVVAPDQVPRPFAVRGGLPEL